MEEFNIYSAVIDGLSHYFGLLDWPYIITFMLLAHFIVKDERVKNLPFHLRGMLVRVPVSWRVLIVGIIYGSFTYWVRDYAGKEGVETIFQSLIASMVCHKLFMGAIIKAIEKKL
jgi:hypothetical protein